MYNGRWVYQKVGADRYLEYGNKYWLGTTGVGKVSGHLHHKGGSICPEEILPGSWSISFRQEDGEWVWQEDPLLRVECLGEGREEEFQHQSNIGPGHRQHSGNVPEPLPVHEPADKGVYVMKYKIS